MDGYTVGQAPGSGPGHRDRRHLPSPVVVSGKTLENLRVAADADVACSDSPEESPLPEPPPSCVMSPCGLDLPELTNPMEPIVCMAGPMTHHRRSVMSSTRSRRLAALASAICLTSALLTASPSQAAPAPKTTPSSVDEAALASKAPDRTIHVNAKAPRLSSSSTSAPGPQPAVGQTIRTVYTDAVSETYASTSSCKQTWTLHRTRHDDGKAISTVDFTRGSGCDPNRSSTISVGHQFGEKAGESGTHSLHRTAKNGSHSFTVESQCRSKTKTFWRTYIQAGSEFFFSPFATLPCGIYS